MSKSYWLIKSEPDIFYIRANFDEQFRKIR